MPGKPYTEAELKKMAEEDKKADKMEKVAEKEKKGAKKRGKLLRNYLEKMRQK